MIVNRIPIKFETASFKIIPDINRKSFQNSLLLPKIEITRAIHFHFKRLSLITKLILSLSPPLPENLTLRNSVLNSRIPFQGMERSGWFHVDGKSAKHSNYPRDVGYRLTENKVANRKIFEASAIRKETLSDENWIRLGARPPLVKGERRLHGSPFTVLVQKELLICANQQISMGARLLALWGKTALLLSRPLCFALW